MTARRVSSRNSLRPTAAGEYGKQARVTGVSPAALSQGQAVETGGAHERGCGKALVLHRARARNSQDSDSAIASTGRPRVAADDGRIA